MRTRQFFKIKSRVSRGGFWLCVFVTWMLVYAAWAVLGHVGSGLLAFFVNVPALAVLALLSIRRLHDRNFSGWFLLLVFVPVFGALWLLWQMAFRRGIAQNNRWGSDPLQSRGDYLVVR